MGTWEWLVWPLAVCLVYVGIHGYLGIHVLSRKVIFVDLAMAQVAALGATYAYVLGYDPSHPEDATAVFLFSLSFTILGAAVFAVTRMRHEKVPQEAFIGIVYATATAIAVLVLTKAPHGGEQLQHMLAGNIILVTKEKVIRTALMYSAVGLFHWIFRRQFFLISLDPERAHAEGLAIRWWDFLFYASFGVVITSSVAVAGVLLVFTYLVVPSSIAVLFAQGIRARIMVGWILGVIVSVLGLVVSYYADFPPGPAVVSAFAVALAVAGIVHYMVHSARPGASLLRLAGGVGGAGLLVFGSTFLAKSEAQHLHQADEFQRLVAALGGGDEGEQVEAIHHLVELKDRHAVGEFVKLLGATKSDRLKEHLAKGLATLGDASAIPALTASAESTDSALKVSIAESLLALRSPEGFRLLIAVVDADEGELYRSQAAKILRDAGGAGQEYDPKKSTAENREALAKLKSWWESRGQNLKWRETTKRFE